MSILKLILVVATLGFLGKKLIDSKIPLGEIINRIIYWNKSDQLSEKYGSLKVVKSILTVFIFITLILGVISSSIVFIFGEDEIALMSVPIILITLINVWVTKISIQVIDFLFDLNDKINS